MAGLISGLLGLLGLLAREEDGPCARLPGRRLSLRACWWWQLSLFFSFFFLLWFGSLACLPGRKMVRALACPGGGCPAPEAPARGSRVVPSHPAPKPSGKPRREALYARQAELRVRWVYEKEVILKSTDARTPPAPAPARRLFFGFYPRDGRWAYEGGSSSGRSRALVVLVGRAFPQNPHLDRRLLAICGS
jgi:hypothetical protein